MPAMTRYNAISEYLGDGTIDLDNNTLRMTLHTSAFTVDVTQDTYAQLDAELPTGNGYTSGGQNLTGVQWTRVDADTSLTSSPVQWTATGGDITAMYCVLSDATSGKLISYGPIKMSADATPVPIDATATDGNTFTLSSSSWVDNG